VMLRQVEVIDRGKLQGGRITSFGTGPGAPAAPAGNVLPQPDTWRIGDIEPTELGNLNPAELLHRMVRISPELARARFDFLRLANPGWTWEALIPGTEEPHEQGQLVLDAFVERLRFRYGTPNVVWNRLLDGLFMRGALLCELILDSAARMALDIATPDPYTADFRLINDPEVGQRWELVQRQKVAGQERIVPIERPTVKYVAVDPLPDTPFGSPMITPALFPALFILTMLQDARRVVAQQGWPRLDIEIDVTTLINTMPAEDRADGAKVKTWIDGVVSEVAQAYTALDPDKAWVHTDAVHIGTPIGAIGNLQGVAPMVDILERMNVRAAKTMPMMMGLPEGVSEANANRQWEMLAKSTEAMQELVEAPLSDLGTIVLEAEGVPAISKFTFLEMRSSEELRDAQALELRLANATTAEGLGYMSRDEASVYAVGHEPAEEVAPGGGAAPGDGTEIDPLEGEEPLEPDAPETPADEDAEDADRMAAHLLRAVLYLAGYRKVEPGVKVDPPGDPSDLPPVPAVVTVDDTDLRTTAARDWDRLMGPEFEGLLVAAVDDEEGE
jgi:hypothetical protein